MSSDIFILGDVRFSEKAKSAFQKYPNSADNFLKEIQSIMLEYGVVKLDVSIDPFNNSIRKHL